jgi:hypothetical protein
VSLESRRQRCALGLPLLGGTSLPIVDRVRPEQIFHPPDADDMRLAVALAEALLAVPPYEEVLGVSGAPCVVEHPIELDAGALDVRLTASHAEAPWDDEHEEENGGELSEEEDEDEGDEKDSASDTAAPARVSHAPNRWRPDPGERPPAPTDPCGCGSGRRYKKCCMPR